MFVSHLCKVGEARKPDKGQAAHLSERRPSRFVSHVENTAGGQGQTLAFVNRHAIAQNERKLRASEATKLFASISLLWDAHPRRVSCHHERTDVCRQMQHPLQTSIIFTGVTLHSRSPEVLSLGQTRRIVESSLAATSLPRRRPLNCLARRFSQNKCTHLPSKNFRSSTVKVQAAKSVKSWDFQNWTSSFVRAASRSRNCRGGGRVQNSGGQGGQWYPGTGSERQGGHASAWSYWQDLVAYADSGYVLWPQSKLRQTGPPHSPPACILSGPAGTQTSWTHEQFAVHRCHARGREEIQTQ